MKSLACVFFIWLLSTTLDFIHAQRPVFESDLSLPTQRLTWGMASGPEGFLWMATEHGLFRFDGHRYVAYNNHPANPNRISQNTVNDVFLTSDKKLLLYNGTQTVDLLGPVSNALTTIDLSKKTSPPGDIRLARQTPDGRIFFITEHGGGYALFEYEKGGFKKHFEVREERPTNPVLTDAENLRFWLVPEPDGTFLLSEHDYGLSQLGPDGQTLRRYIFENGVGDGRLLNVLWPEKQAGHLLAFKDKKGLFKFDRQTGKIELDGRFPENYFYVKCWEDEKGNLVVGVGEDARDVKEFILLDTKGEVVHFPNLYNQFINRNFVYGKDFSDFFFYASELGLRKLNTGQSNIKSHLAGRAVSTRGIVGDGRGNLIVGTERSGWYLLEKETGNIMPISFDGMAFPDLKPPTFTRNFLRDANGDIWASAYGASPSNVMPHGYLLRYRHTDRSIEAYKGKYRLGALLLAKSGLIYAASYSVLQSFDPATGQFTDIPGGYGEDAPQGMEPNCIAQTSDGFIWIGTDQGLVQFNPSNGKFMWLKNGGNNPVPFSSDYIMAIHEGADGRLWLGTQQGLNVFDRATGEVEIFTQKNGLPDNNICGILPDLPAGLWLSTFNGLSYFDLKEKRFRNFFSTDGFNNNEFNRHSFYRDSDGTCYFGGMDGFNSFRPEDLLKGRPMPRILLSELSYFSKNSDSLLVRTTGLQSLQSVSLPADKRSLHLRFAITNFTRPELNRYAAFLEGYDPDWVSLGNTSELRYNNLPPGRYTLHLKGFGPNGTPSENTIALRVEVEQFFFKTTWFYLLCLLVAGGLIGGWIWRLRTEKSRLETEVEKRTQQILLDKQTIEKQSLALQELDQMKSRFFANISHELRTPLTLILSPLRRMLKNETLDKTTIRQHLELMDSNGQQLHRRIDELLELSRLDAGKSSLREQPVELHGLLRRTLDRFETAAIQKGICIHMDWQLPERVNLLLDEPKFEKIIGNLVGNAVKFTAAGEVKLAASAVSTSSANSTLLLKITDTGKGIPPYDLPHIFDRYFQTKRSAPTEGGTGIGLAMAKEFAQMMGGEITVESEVGKGSTFTLVLPLKLVENGAAPTTIDPDEMAFAPQLSNHPAIKPSNHRETILLAEDNADLRNYLQMILSPHYQVVAFENGKQLWESISGIDKRDRSEEGNISIAHPLNLSSSHPLILSDVMMPEMDGFTLLEKVKADGRLRRIPFVMLTAKAGIENRLQALRIGVDDYLLKPFDEEELLLRIANLLENQRLRLEYFAEEKNDALETDEPVEPGWLEEVERLAKTSLTDPQFSMDFLAGQLGLGRSSFYRRIKSETGLTPNLYLREVRLQEARCLLESGGQASVAGIAEQVGFQKRAYFSKLFAERFGRSPASYFERG